MPRIESIETQSYNVPLKSALAWGKGHQLAELNHVLIRVRLSDGATGVAEATPRPTIYGETQASVSAIVEQELAPRIVGKTINQRDDIDRLDKQLTIIKNNNTAKGALNIALHEALAQSQGQSLADYLNVQHDTIRVSYIVGTGSDDVVLEDVAQIYEQGVRVFKTKIGKQISNEIALIQRLQNNFPEAEFYVDANQCLHQENAESVLQSLHAMGVLYCEEPLSVHQLQARQQLRQQTKIPIIADDSTFTLTDLKREIVFNTFDIVNIKTPRTGFSQSFKMVEMARANGKTIMLGSQASSLHGAVHTALFAAAVQANHATECTFFLKTNTHHAMPVIQAGRLKIQDIVNTTMQRQ